MITKEELKSAYSPEEVRGIFEYIKFMKCSERNIRKAIESARTKDGQP